MKFRKLLLLPIFLFLFSSCDPNGTDPINPGTITTHVESISLNKNTLTLEEGDSETLRYTINPNNATNKDVEWSSSNSIVASVNNGQVKAWNEGTTSIKVKTKDGNKEDICVVTVNKKEPEKTYVKTPFDLNNQGYTDSNKSLTNVALEFSEYRITFAVGTNTRNNQPTLIKATNKHYEARIYWGNTFKVTSTTHNLERIEFTLGENDKGNTFTCSTGTISNGVWSGTTKEVTFSVLGSEGYKAFECFTPCYEGETSEDPNTLVNLGEMKISEVKDYISSNPVTKNAFGNGVNEKRYVTIKGYALAKIDLIKSTAKYGLDVSEHGKIIMGDDTGTIAVASTVNNLGTSLWGKIGEHVSKSTSKYVVTGYISEYLGHPEILVTSFLWDQNLDIELNYSKISKETISLTEFYTKSKAVNYNCAGHGYGDVVTIENLKCYYSESDGQGKRYYNFTDGSKNIRVNAFNINNATVGNVYNVTGIISLKNYSPIIVAFKIESVLNKDVTFNYVDSATNITVENLKNIKGSQDDTSTKYPELIANYGEIYKTTGYMVAVDEGGKLYVGISDTPRTTLISGKTNAMANYNVVLIKNENFWNTTEEELYLFNSYYQDYLCEENPITIYYVVRQLEYSDSKACWEILLIPDSIPEMVSE